MVFMICLSLRISRVVYSLGLTDNYLLTCSIHRTCNSFAIDFNSLCQQPQREDRCRRTVNVIDSTRVSLKSGPQIAPEYYAVWKPVLIVLG